MLGLGVRLWAVLLGDGQLTELTNRQELVREGNGNPLHVLAWRMPGTEEPGRLPSVGSHRVGHD